MRKVITFFLVFILFASSIGVVSANNENGDRAEENTRYWQQTQLLLALGILDSTYTSFNQPQSTLSVGIVRTVLSNFTGFPEEFTERSSITFGKTVELMIQTLGYYMIMDIEEVSDSAYLSKGAELGLTKGVLKKMDELITSESFVQMLVNMLDIEMLKPYATEKDAVRFEARETFLQSQNIEKRSGIVEATSITRLGSIERTNSGYVMIDKIIYDVGVTNASDLLGYFTEFYVRDTGQEDHGVLLYITEKESNESIVVKAEDIQSNTDIEKISYYDREKDKEQKARLNVDFYLVYNGVTTLKKSLDLLKPERGHLRLLDNNGDGSYDVVFVTSYEIDVISGVDSAQSTIYLKNSNAALDLSDEKKIIKFQKNNEPSSLEMLREDDIIYLAKSKSGGYISIEASDSKVSGVVCEIRQEDHYNYCVIGEQSYPISKAVDMKNFVGNEITISLGPDGVGEKAELQYASHYGLLIDAAKTTGIGEEYQVRVFDDTGVIQDYFLCDTAYLYSDSGSKVPIGEGQIAALKAYAHDCIEASTGGYGLGMAAPIIMFRLVDQKIKTISLPVVYDENAAGSKRDPNVFMAATKKSEMVNRQSRNLYHAENNSFNPESAQNLSDGAYKYLMADTIIFEVPVNENNQLEAGYEDDAKVYLGSQFTYNSWLNNSFYNLGDDRGIGVMINYVTNTGSVDYAKAFLVNRVTRISEDGTDYIKVTGTYNGQDNVSYVISEDVTINIDSLTDFQNTAEVIEIKSGDYFLPAFDQKGRIKYIKMILQGSLGKSQYKRCHNARGYDHTNEMVFGTVVDKVGDLITIEVEINNFNVGETKCYVNQYKRGNVYSYDADEKRASIADYKQINIGSTVLVRSTFSSVQDILILK